MIGYVVESAVLGPGGRVATARIYVATPARAAQLAGDKPGATWNPIDYADMPHQARAALEKEAAKTLQG